MTYTLDYQPGTFAYAVRAEGHQSYLAETYHTAEVFAQMLCRGGGGAILLETETETGRAERVMARAATLLAERVIVWATDEVAIPLS